MDIAGHCTCKKVRYRLTIAPLFVHACHCRWCQRETGSAFAVNALIELSNIELLEGELETVSTDSASGKGQQIVRCVECRVALWSHYAYGKLADVIAFVRVGTLNEPAQLPPDIHIYTEAKVPWLSLSRGVPVVQQYYSAKEQWPPESLERRATLLAQIE